MSIRQVFSQIALTFVAFTGLSLLGQQEERKADHEALRALRAQVAEAIHRQDMKALSSCMAKTFTFTTVNQKRVTTPGEIQAVFEEFFKGPGSFIVSHQTVPEADALTHFLDEKTGIASGISRESYVLKGGRTVNMTVRWTATVIKEEGSWKVAAAHVGVDPLDNPILSTATSFWKRIGITAGPVGLLLGFLLGYFFRRKACGRPA